MKNLVKFVILIAVILTAITCKKKEEKIEPNVDKEIQQKTWERQQQESLLYNSNSLTSNMGVFFEELLESVDLTILKRRGTCYLIKSGSKISYYRDNNNYNGILKNDIITININGEMWINGGKILNFDELSFDSVDFELYQFPKTLYTGVAIKFANKYPGAYWPITSEELPKYLENLYEYVNLKDKYGYRIDLTKVCYEGIGVEFTGYEVLAFSKDKKLRATREEVQGKAYNSSVVDNFVLLPRSQK